MFNSPPYRLHILMFLFCFVFLQINVMTTTATPARVSRVHLSDVSVTTSTQEISVKYEKVLISVQGTTCQ